MKFFDKISEALGLYEEDDEIIEETPSETPEEKPAKKSLFSRKSAAPVREVPAAPAEPEPERKSFFKSKTTAMPASKTISIPMAQKQVLCWSRYRLTIRRKLPITLTAASR